MIHIFIPVYNEAENIEKVVKKMTSEMEKLRYINESYMIYIYDNFSNDGTYSIIRKLARNDLHIQIDLVYRKGKGEVFKKFLNDLKSGEIQCANNDLIVMIDGDDTYSPFGLADKIKNIKSYRGYDIEAQYQIPRMYVGDRMFYYDANGSILHGFGNKLIRKLFRIFYHEYSDIFSGCRIFTPGFLKGFKLKGHRFELETELTHYALRNNYPIGTFRVFYKDRAFGKSKINSVRDGISILWTFWNNLIKDYPAMLILPSLIGTAIGIPCLISLCKRNK